MGKFIKYLGTKINIDELDREISNKLNESEEIFTKIQNILDQEAKNKNYKLDYFVISDPRIKDNGIKAIESLFNFVGLFNQSNFLIETLSDPIGRIEDLAAMIRHEDNKYNDSGFPFHTEEGGRYIIIATDLIKSHPSNNNNEIIKIKKLDI